MSQVAETPGENNSKSAALIARNLTADSCTVAGYFGVEERKNGADAGDARRDPARPGGHPNTLEPGKSVASALEWVDGSGAFCTVPDDPSSLLVTAPGDTRSATVNAKSSDGSGAVDGCKRQLSIAAAGA